jgi:hypothetical protein
MEAILVMDATLPTWFAWALLAHALLQVHLAVIQNYIQNMAVMAVTAAGQDQRRTV